MGKKKLEAGIAAYKAAHPSTEDSFDVTWYPFQLDASLPSPGVDKKEVYRRKIGDAARVEALHERMTGIGAEHGIKFSFNGLMGNTRDSHRLVDLAKSQSAAMQDKVISALFESYFEKEQDISDRKVLQEAGVKAGLQAGAVQAMLESDERGPEVDRELKKARQSLITGVPNFVIQGKYELQGAQDADGFRQVFERIKELESKG